MVQKSDAQQMTLLQNQAASTSTTTKTITLAQAQQMGFKIIPQVAAPKQTIMLNKAPKTVKIVPQVTSYEYESRVDCIIVYFIGEIANKNIASTTNY